MKEHPILDLIGQKVRQQEQREHLQRSALRTCNAERLTAFTIRLEAWLPEEDRQALQMTLRAPIDDATRPCAEFSYLGVLCALYPPQNAVWALIADLPTGHEPLTRYDLKEGADAPLRDQLAEALATITRRKEHVHG